MLKNNVPANADFSAKSEKQSGNLGLHSIKQFVCCSFWGRRSSIVEGIFSRSGVGNDLFAESKEVQRILCPPNNAYSDYERIKECIKKYGQGKTILIMLGPTAKILAYELALEGYRAIDLGHVDSEYEWCKMGVHKKVKLDSKHTAEWNTDECIQDVSDELYHSQIICNLAEDMPTQS